MLKGKKVACHDAGLAVIYGQERAWTYERIAYLALQMVVNCLCATPKCKTNAECHCPSTISSKYLKYPGHLPFFFYNKTLRPNGSYCKYIIYKKKELKNYKKQKKKEYTKIKDQLCYIPASSSLSTKPRKCYWRVTSWRQRDWVGNRKGDDS